MEELLSILLERLRLIGEEHSELYDSEVREQMGEAIMEGFIREQKGFRLPDQFGMYSDEANRRVKAAIAKYIEGANKKTSEVGLKNFHDRLAAFQNSKVQTSVPGNDYEEFFGHTSPEFYDEYGNVIRTY